MSVRSSQATPQVRMSLIYHWRLRFVPFSELSVSWPCGTQIIRKWTCFGWPNMSLQRPHKVSPVLATYWQCGCGIHCVSLTNMSNMYLHYKTIRRNERGGITRLVVSALTKMRTGDVRIWDRFLSLAETCLYSIPFKLTLGSKHIYVYPKGSRNSFWGLNLPTHHRLKNAWR